MGAVCPVWIGFAAPHEVGYYTYCHSECHQHRIQHVICSQAAHPSLLLEHHDCTLDAVPSESKGHKDLQYLSQNTSLAYHCRL